MPNDIKITDLTNATKLDNGTGVFDILTKSVNMHIQDQYETGRITGNDYSTVYLGALQSTLSESIKFLLQEQISSEQASLIASQVLSENKNNEDGGIIDQQKRKLQEEIDLVIAKTAGEYESIDASSSDTTRKNLLNSKDVIYREKQTELVIRQESELELDGIEQRKLTVEKTIATTSGGLDSTNKVNAEVALTNAQQTKVEAEKILVDSKNAEIAPNALSERAVNTADITLKTSQNAEVAPNALAQRDKIASEIVLLTSQNAEVAPNALAQRAKITSEITLLTSQNAEIAPNALSERNKTTSEITLLDSKNAEIAPNALAERNKVSAEITLLDSKNAEIAANALAERNKVSAEITLLTSQNAEIAPNALAQRNKTASEITLLNSKNAETLAGTIRLDDESAQRVLLMEAQTVGFGVNAKQNLLKQLYEGYAVNVTTVGEVTGAPTGSTSTSLDSIANDILNDLGSTVNV